MGRSSCERSEQVRNCSELLRAFRAFRAQLRANNTNHECFKSPNVEGTSKKVAFPNPPRKPEEATTMPSFRFFLFIVINFVMLSTNRVNALAIGNPTNISKRKLRGADVISDGIVRVNDADAKSIRVVDKLELLVGKTVNLEKFEGQKADFSKLKNVLREKDLSGLKAYLKKHPVKLNKSFYKRVQAIVNEDPVESRSAETVGVIALISLTLFYGIGGIIYVAVAN